MSTTMRQLAPQFGHTRRNHGFTVASLGDGEVRNAKYMQLDGSSLYLLRCVVKPCIFAFLAATVIHGTMDMAMK
jgi:hypothetical protein